jgi:hypothetical protein
MKEKRRLPCRTFWNLEGKDLAKSAHIESAPKSPDTLGPWKEYGSSFPCHYSNPVQFIQRIRVTAPIGMPGISRGGNAT